MDHQPPRSERGGGRPRPPSVRVDGNGRAAAIQEKSPALANRSWSGRKVGPSRGAQAGLIDPGR